MLRKKNVEPLGPDCDNPRATAPGTSNTSRIDYDSSFRGKRRDGTACFEGKRRCRNARLGIRREAREKFFPVGGILKRAIATLSARGCSNSVLFPSLLRIRCRFSRCLVSGERLTCANVKSSTSVQVSRNFTIFSAFFKIVFSLRFTLRLAN